MQSGIYRITNGISGKTYIGSAAVIAARWAAHKSSLGNGVHENRFLQAAWDKHGASAFEFEVLEYAAVNLLHEREQFWLDNSDCHLGRGGYNISPSAGTCRGVIHSEESRLAMSAAKKGKFVPWNKGLAMSESYCKLHSESKKRYSATIRGRLVLENMVEAAKSPQARAKNGAKKRGKKPSQESRAAMSESQSRFWASATDEQRAARGFWRGIPRPEHGEKLKGRPRADRRSMSFARAEEIRAAKAVGKSYTELEQMFGMTRAPLHRIVAGKTYARPTDDELK